MPRPIPLAAPVTIAVSCLRSWVRTPRQFHHVGHRASSPKAVERSRAMRPSACPSTGSTSASNFAFELAPLPLEIGIRDASVMVCGEPRAVGGCDRHLGLGFRDRSRRTTIVAMSRRRTSSGSRVTASLNVAMPDVSRPAKRHRDSQPQRKLGLESGHRRSDVADAVGDRRHADLDRLDGVGRDAVPSRGGARPASIAPCVR